MTLTVGENSAVARVFNDPYGRGQMLIGLRDDASGQEIARIAAIQGTEGFAWFAVAIVVLGVVADPRQTTTACRLVADRVCPSCAEPHAWPTGSIGRSGGGECRQRDPSANRLVSRDAQWLRLFPVERRRLGRLSCGEPARRTSHLDSGLSGLAAGFASYIVNHAIASVAIRLASGVSIWTILRSVLAVLPLDLAYGIGAAGIAYFYAEGGAVYLAMLLLPAIAPQGFLIDIARRTNAHNAERERHSRERIELLQRSLRRRTTSGSRPQAICTTDLSPI